MGTLLRGGGLYRRGDPPEALLQPLTARTDVRRHGGKAVHLRRLVEEGLPVPTAWIVDVEELAAIERGGDAPALDPGRTYAVRSSATVEDGAARSFAGQFASVLDVPGTAAALGEALRAVAASARTDAVAGYARAAGIDPASIRMAAVVQEMVPAVAAGIAFSTNPITGLEEVVVEAVAGGGEALAQDGATPSRWVDRFGALTERPDAGPIGDDVALAIGREVRRVAAAVGVPVDLEWVADGERVWWVQLRPITALARTPIYSNRISREVFPGMIAPFVWSLNTRFVNRAWHRLITRAIGPNAIDPDALARPFAFRAYFDMGAFGEVFASFGMPRRSMEMLLGLPTGEERPRMRPSAASLRKVPRLLALAGTALRFPGRVPRDLARLDARVAAIAATDPDTLDADALLRRIDDLSDVLRDYAWMNILGPFLQMGWTAALRRRADGAAEALDPGREAPERRAIDPGSAIADLAALVATLPADARERLRAAGAEAVDDPRWREAWSGFLARFGHLSDRPNDCSVPSWREEPEVPLGLVLGHAPTTSAAASPHALEGSRAWRRAARARVQRETIGYGYARAYAAFRPTVLALGEHLRDRGVVAERDDVFLLDLAEVRALVAGGDVAARALVAQRRAAFADLRDLEMPETIVGDDFVPRRPGEAARVLRGVATSPGRRSGAVRVVRTLREGDALLPGEILVLPASDVTWTPLFSRAAAVVTESGGMLAHASVVARELGIPCVASATGATALRDGTGVLVDGYAGEVVVLGGTPA